MDPLSALKIMPGALPASPLNDPTTQAASPLTIPAQELQGINSDLSTQSATGAVSPASGGSFSSMLGDFVGEVNDKQNAADDAISGLMSGKNVSLHQAMISMEEASISFQMMVEVRNKLLDSYQELMRMQI